MKLEFGRTQHPSAASLLAWAEGELPWWRQLAVSRHVRSCWQCRASARHWEETVCAVTSGLRDLPEPSRAETAKAYWRFLEASRGIRPSSARRLWRLGPAWVAAAASVIAAAGVAVVTIQTPLFHRQAVPAPLSRPSRPLTPPAPASVFPHAPSAPRPIPAPIPLDLSLAPPPAILPPASEEKLLSAEIYALFELHRSRLCRFDVVRAGNSIEVRGVLVSNDHRDRLSALFQEPGYHGLIRLRLQEHPGPAHSAPLSQAPARSVSPSASPLEQTLRERFGARATQRDIFNLMGELVLNAETVSEHAWALRRLADRFPASRARTLPPDLQELLLVMAADHAKVVASASGILWRRTAQQETAAAAPDFQASDPGGRNQTWQVRALLLQELAEAAAGGLLASVSNSGGAPPAFDRFEYCAAAALGLHTSLQLQLAQSR